jgi:hypothetical protein
VIPRIISKVIVGDDPFLLAQLSCICSRPRFYLPILDGPHVFLPNQQSEVIRRSNLVARLASDQIVLAGLSDSTCTLFAGRFPAERTHRVANVAEFRQIAPGLPRRDRLPPLSWGNQKLGLGLLRALREHRQIAFDGSRVNDEPVAALTNHLVVCEEGEDHAQIVAANYAYSLGAGLQLVPSIPQEEAEAILDEFYSLYDPPDSSESPTWFLERLRERLRRHIGDLRVPTGGAITFITRRVPYGFAFSEVPNTHLFSYPDLGVTIASALLEEHVQSPGIRVGVVVDPGSVEGKETQAAIQSFQQSGAYLRGLQGRRATVLYVDRTLELFPYDLLLISTHCGDAPGRRHTYEFTDTEGIARTLVVDLAVGVASQPGDDMVDVTLFYSFVSLDGVPWNDPAKKAKLYIGRAIIDFMERDRNDRSFRPTKSEDVARVPRSAALRMYDGNYIPIPRSLAAGRTPIVINNACASWHRLAISFTVANARVYIGTLFSVTEVEAQEFVSQVLRHHFGKSLAVAVWHAHNQVYGVSVRRPYIMVGCHFQRLSFIASDAPRDIIRDLTRSLDAWRRMQSSAGASEMRNITDRVRFIEEELEGMRSRWPIP